MHYLSGPCRVVDSDGVPAKPGDLLAVEICNLGPLPGDEWGYTATFDRENGGGFLTDHFPAATKAIWYFEGIFASSPHIPGWLVIHNSKCNAFGFRDFAIRYIVFFSMGKRRNCLFQA